MTGPALVAALGLELHHAELRPALVAQDAGRDADARHRLAVNDLRPVHVQQRLELDALSVANRQTLDEQGLALLDAILLAAGFHDCVGHAHSEGALPDWAFAPERRRPPLRPRRRGFDSRTSSET